MFINVVAEPRLIKVRSAVVSKSFSFLTKINYTAINVPYHTQHGRNTVGGRRSCFEPFGVLLTLGHSDLAVQCCLEVADRLFCLHYSNIKYSK